MGAAGVLIASSAGQESLPAVPGDIRDVTGAGDALIGATLADLARDMPMASAVRHGLVAASVTLGYQGAVRPDIAEAIAAAAGR